MTENKTYMTIRETARTGIITEYRLRALVHQSKAPCIYAGSKCLVNYPALVEMLDAQSRAAVKN